MYATDGIWVEESHWFGPIEQTIGDKRQDLAAYDTQVF